MEILQINNIKKIQPASNKLKLMIKYKNKLLTRIILDINI